mgnify:CR=1 FL=1
MVQNRYMITGHIRSCKTFNKSCGFVEEGFAGPGAQAKATRQMQTVLIAVITHASSHRLSLQFALPSCQTEARPSWCQLCSCTSSLAQLTIACFCRQKLVWSPARNTVEQITFNDNLNFATCSTICGSKAKQPRVVSN